MPYNRGFRRHRLIISLAVVLLLPGACTQNIETPAPTMQVPSPSPTGSAPAGGVRAKCSNWTIGHVDGRPVVAGKRRDERFSAAEI